jgi:dTDP-4-dehydrorhamnose reductase
MRVLLLGAAGQVGAEVCALAPARGVEVVAPPRATLDLTQPQAVCRVVEVQPWSAVINAAAYTDVDLAESQESEAFAVNAVAPARLAAATGRRGIPLIHISTDYVFDGRKGAPYLEHDRALPLNAYGRSKLAGERGIAAGNPRHVIVRTAWVYSPHRKNFVKTVLRLARERDRLTVVADARGCPTAARDVAHACLEIAIRCARQPERAPYGIYHFAGAGEASWFDLAQEIVALACGRAGKPPQIVPIRAEEYRAAAVRPADTRLDCGLALGTFALAPRPWQAALAETVERLLGARDIP